MGRGCGIQTETEADLFIWWLKQLCSHSYDHRKYTVEETEKVLDIATVLALSTYWSNALLVLQEKKRLWRERCSNHRYQGLGSYNA